jgi:peptidoglycan/LPS O-acetylase OafA/YrhL
MQGSCKNKRRKKGDDKLSVIPGASMPMPPDPILARRADLDWLRVVAFGLLILYHAGMAWSGWNGPLASSEHIGWLREGMRFLDRWRMPLIFVVSGAAITLALGTRSAHVFAADRVRRLLLPLAFGMIVLGRPKTISNSSIMANSVAPSWTLCRKRSPARIQAARCTGTIFGFWPMH